MACSPGHWHGVAVALIVSDGMGGYLLIGSKDLRYTDFQWNVTPDRPLTFALEVRGFNPTMLHSSPVATAAPHLPSGIYLPDFAYAVPDPQSIVPYQPLAQAPRTGRRYEPLAIALIISDGYGGHLLVSSQRLDYAVVEIGHEAHWRPPFIGDPSREATNAGPTSVAFRVEARAATVFRSQPTAPLVQLPSGMYLPQFAYAALPSPQAPLLLPAPCDDERAA